MNKRFGLLLPVFLWFINIATTQAQDGWPKSIVSADGNVIRIFHPQPDSLVDNNLRFIAAFSYTRKGTTIPIYGAITAWAVIETDRNSRTLNLRWANVTGLRLAINMSPDSADILRETISCGLPGIGREISLDRLIPFLAATNQPKVISTGLDHTPPRIIVWSRPAILAFIDGIPKLKWNKDYGLYSVANSPFTILESSDSWFYLYGGRHWYIAPSPEGPWHPTTYIAPDLHHVTALINSINDRESEHSDTLREGNAGIIDILFSTTPAELVRTSGPPVFSPVAGTRLLYAVNSNNDLFFDSLLRFYYVLVSGRWFGAPALTGPWRYLPADSLPNYFSAIPEGSPADRVLASVPGTPAAREALVDAVIPQTALIDRHAATAHVAYDGPPRWAPVIGTQMQYVVNTSAQVMYSAHAFYCLDKGVWFTAKSPNGPWLPSTERPAGVDNIPPDCPIYNAKFVYIYSAGADTINTGYTAGYLQSYIDGNTLVYGTGYHMASYTGNLVMPKPWTYGFNIWYNPWLGWSLGYDCPPNWLNTTVAWGEGGWTGGWFGPPDYRPPYIWHHFSGHGLYAHNYRLFAPGSYNNNLYTLRNDVTPVPSAELAVTSGEGRVYCLDAAGRWTPQERLVADPDQNTASIKATAPLPDNATSLDQILDNLRRGEMRLRNFQQAGGIFLLSPQQLPSHAETRH